MTNSHIQRVLGAHSDAPSSEIANTLLLEIKDLDHPYQDNVSLTVVKVQDQAQRHDCHCAASLITEEADQRGSNDAR